MSSVPPDQDTGAPPNDTNPELMPKDLLRKLGIVWLSWLLEVSKDIQPLIKEAIIFVFIILKEIIIFGIFILGELLIIGWTEPAFADVAKFYPPIDGLYDIIKIASLLLIIIHYVGNCIVDITQQRETFSKIFPKRFNLFSILWNKIFNRPKPALVGQSFPAIQPASKNEDESQE